MNYNGTKKIFWGIAICIVIIIVLLAISMILLYKVKDLAESSDLNTENNIADINSSLDNDDKVADTNSELNIIYIKKSGKNATLTLPQINENTEGAKSINEKINNLYNIDYIQGVSNTIICTDSLKYNNKNLMGIHLNLENENDNGIVYYFYYDLDAKEEFTLKDIIESEGFSISDINEKYQETLDSMAKLWGGEANIKGRDYTITGKEMFYTTNNQSEENGHYVNTLNIVIPIDEAYCLMNGKINSVIVQYEYIDDYLQF